MATNNTVQYTITAKDQASAVFAGVATKVKGSAENIEKGIQKLSKTASAGMGALSGDFSKLGDAIGGIGGPAAAMGAAVVGALGSMITKTMEASEGFRKLSERTGASVEFLSGFTQAADDMFVSADTVSASLTIFAKKLGGAEDAMDGSGVSAGAFAKKLQEIGINSDNVEEALGQVADRFAGMKDGTEKTALAVQLFGKQGVELIPILNKGRDGINEMTAAAKGLGLVMTTETTQAVTRLKQVLDNLGDRAEGAALNMGSGLVKAAADAGEAFLKFDDQQRMMWQRADADNWLGFTLRVYKQFTEVNGKMVKTLSVSNQALREQGEWALDAGDGLSYTTSKTYDAATAYQQMYGNLNHVSEGLHSQAKSAADTAKAEDDAKASAAALAEKKQALADAVNNVKGAFSGTPKLMDDAEKAETLLLLSTGNLTKEQLAQRQASEAIRDAMGKNIISWEAGAAALVGLAKGTLSTDAAFVIAKSSGATYRGELNLIEGALGRIPDTKAVVFTGFVTPQMTDAITLYNSIQDKRVTVTTTMVTNTLVEQDDGTNRRARGGPVQKGKPYIVGEERPELFVPNTSGYILPNVPYAAQGQRAAGAVSGTFNVNNPGIVINSVNGAAIAQDIARGNANVARRARSKATFMG